MKPLKLLDLFSGIGGFSLGLERSEAFKTVAFCEIEPFCRRVLAKHWPDVLCYDDVRTLTGNRLTRDGIEVDAICGGFPCQDISLAGKGAGIENGARSGLWSEIARLTGEVRPRFVIVENVSAILIRGIKRVLGDLASLGYDAEWHCIPASAIGAPHRRDRFWLVAYPASQRCGEARRLRRDQSEERIASGGEALTNADSAGFPVPRQEQDGTNGEQGWRTASSGDWWRVEPDVGRMAYGVPSRVDRLKGLGNAIVPQVAEIIGRAIGSTLPST